MVKKNKRWRLRRRPRPAGELLFKRPPPLARRMDRWLIQDAAFFVFQVACLKLESHTVYKTNYLWENLVFGSMWTENHYRYTTFQLLFSKCDTFKAFLILVTRLLEVKAISNTM